MEEVRKSLQGVTSTNDAQIDAMFDANIYITEDSQMKKEGFSRVKRWLMIGEYSGILQRFIPQCMGGMM
jgi:hypothetical protein